MTNKPQCHNCKAKRKRIDALLQSANSLAAALTTISLSPDGICTGKDGRCYGFAYIAKQALAEWDNLMEKGDYTRLPDLPEKDIEINIRELS